MRRTWIMGLAGGAAIIATGAAIWMLAAGETAQAGGLTAPAATGALDPGAASSAVGARASSAVATPALQDSHESGAGRAAHAIAALEARGELPVLDRTDSLTGIDADANGIRDDLDRYIDRTFGDAAQREAAIKLTQTIQQILLVDTGNHVAVMNLARRHTNRLSCFSSRFKGDQAAGSELRRQLHSLTTNTKERLLAYLRFDQALSGQTFRLPQGDGCE